MTLTEAEREALSDWWLTGSEGDLHATVEAIIAARLAPAVAVLAHEWYDEPPTTTYPEGRRLYRWPADLRVEMSAALGVSAPTGDPT
jgi:hypothetical protein